MWQLQAIPHGDPLRQGDLLVDLELPVLKPPFQSLEMSGVRFAVVPTKKFSAIVVSQCCDNENGDYVAVAPLRRQSNMSEAQESALLQYEPGGASYVISDFRLQPISEFLPPLPVGQHHVAMLTKTVPFVGRTDFIGRRRARMSDEGRRYLRMNLQLLWGRAEETDIVSLAGKGIPEGPR